MSSKRKTGKKTTLNKNGTIECNKKTKTLKNVHLSSSILSSTEKFKKCWQEKQPLTINEEDSEIELLNTPYQLCHIRNFIKDGNPFLEDLKDELADIEYSEKSNDLYQFHQSKDLASIDSSCINAVRDFLYQDVVAWVREVTGIPLLDTVDVTCSRYDHTDYLLCHDDKCQGRKIAFILYLTHNWSVADGGTLDLFDRDESKQPRDIIRSLVPDWNSFVFFEVSEASFHQVSEVLTEDKIRVSLNGWFHAFTNPFDSSLNDVLPLCTPVESELDLQDWISMRYLIDSTHRDVNKIFEANSEIRLDSFLNPEAFDSVARAFHSSEIQWNLRGPPNKRHYEVATIQPGDQAPSSLWQLVELLQSQQMFELMASMTDLELSDVNPDMGDTRPQFYCEVQRWRPGSYTLMHSRSSPGSPCLELILYFNCDALTTETGGYSSYVAKDEDEELLTVLPCANSLVLTYRDLETLSFVKYVNHMFKSSFHSISLYYFERNTV